MNSAKCTDQDYIDLLIAHPTRCTATEAQRVQPDERPKAHDAFTRLLHRLEPHSEALWKEVANAVPRTGGVLVVDDSTLDKPYAKHIELVSRHWSGKHKAVVKGINLLTCLWTDGDILIPTDYRIFDKPNDHKTKNDLFAELLQVAHSRGLTPDYVMFDSWYASLANLKLIRSLGYRWLTRLKSNRKVNPDNTTARPLYRCEISAEGTMVHLTGYGMVKVFRIDTPDGDTQYWATDDSKMDSLTRQGYGELSWGIEEYHRGLKQHCLVEKAQVRAGRAQRNHIGLSIRAFWRLEWHRFKTGVSWFEAKLSIVRKAIKEYFRNPVYKPQPTA